MKIMTCIALALMSAGVCAQTCNPAVARTAPDERYQPQNQSAEVLDKQSRLLWQRCYVGQSWTGTSCAGQPALYEWQQALAYAKKQGKGWRVPTIDELKSLVEAACYGPALNATYFPDMPLDNETWSASEDGKEYASYVTFYNGEGGSNDKVNAFYLRLVKTAP